MCEERKVSLKALVVVNSKSNVELLYRFVGAAYHQDNSVWQVPPRVCNYNCTGHSLVSGLVERTTL